MAPISARGGDKSWSTDSAGGRRSEASTISRVSPPLVISPFLPIHECPLKPLPVLLVAPADTLLPSHFLALGFMGKSGAAQFPTTVRCPTQHTFPLLPVLLLAVSVGPNPPIGYPAVCHGAKNGNHVNRFPIYLSYMRETRAPFFFNLFHQRYNDCYSIERVLYSCWRSCERHRWNDRKVLFRNGFAIYKTINKKRNTCVCTTSC